MQKYTFENLNPYKNTIYQEFYQKLFQELGIGGDLLGFPANCKTVYRKAIYMPQRFMNVLTTRSMKSSSKKIQTAHSYKTSERMIDTRYEHMCFAYMLGVDFLLILEKNGYQIDAKTQIAFLLKLLLHDNGHGPFSHPFEQMVDGYKGMHEDIGNRNILEDPELYQHLENIYPGLAHNIVHFEEMDKYGLQELVEGVFDLDRASFLIIDTWLSNSKLYPENTEEQLEKLIDSIYHIFEHIILRNGKVYYHPACFYDVEFFLKKRAYNYIHIYNGLERLLDDMLLHQYGVYLLQKQNTKAFLRPLLEPVGEFQSFLKEIKEKQAMIDLEQYFHYSDDDMHRIVMLSQLIENENLEKYARLFLSSEYRMKIPFDIEQVDQKTWEKETKENPNLMSAKTKINIYKSTEKEHIIFMDPKTGETTDFKDMKERTLNIDPIQAYYLYHERKPKQMLKHDQRLRHILEDYFYKNAIPILRICLTWQYENEENSILNHLIPLLIHIAKNKPLEEYAMTKQITMKQVYTLLSFYSGDEKWENYANFLRLSPEDLSICFMEIKVDHQTFISELECILKDNIPLTEETHPIENLIQMLCIFGHDETIFIDQAILESNYFSEETRKQIKGQIRKYKIGNSGYQKKYKI